MYCQAMLSEKRQARKGIDCLAKRQLVSRCAANIYASDSVGRTWDHRALRAKEKNELAFDTTC